MYMCLFNNKNEPNRTGGLPKKNQRKNA